mgnify:CR=1 FL=1
MHRVSASRRLTGMILFVPAAITVLALAGAPAVESAAPTPEQAMSMLREGNTRFAEDSPLAPHTTAARLRETAEKGQSPFATILTCADSRIPVERVFDQGVGDVFVVRVAGNVSDTDEIGTIEYGVGHLHTPLVIVMGHTGCGAVTAVAQNAELHGAMASLVDNIRPAVEFIRRNRPELNEKELIAAAIEANVWQSIDDLLSNSAETRKLVNDGSIKIVGAMYELASGRVRFMGEHPYQDRIIETASKSVAGHASAAEHNAAPAPAQAHAPIPAATSTENVPTHAESPATHAPEHAPNDADAGKESDSVHDEHGHQPH